MLLYVIICYLPWCELYVKQKILAEIIVLS